MPVIINALVLYMALLLCSYLLQLMYVPIAEYASVTMRILLAVEHPNATASRNL